MIKSFFILSFHFRYVHNNIFFSFAVDADLEQLSRKRAADTNLNTSINSSEKVSNDESKGEPGRVVESGQESAETQLAESEQATYASANNDLKGTKAYQEADVPGLYNLAMAIIDYRGHRVVAQVCIKDVIALPFFRKLVFAGFFLINIVD